MTTVYAIDIRRKLKVRYAGVVHYAATEQLVDCLTDGLTSRAQPHGARCGARFDATGETPAYLENAEAVVVTCVACLGDRRRG